MKLSAIFFFVLLSGFSSLAQSKVYDRGIDLEHDLKSLLDVSEKQLEESKFEYEDIKSSSLAIWNSKRIPIHYDNSDSLMSISANWRSTEDNWDNIEIRFQSENDWTVWEKFNLTHHPIPQKKVSQLIFKNGKFTAFQLRMLVKNNDLPIDQLSIHFYFPKKSPRLITQNEVNKNGNNCLCDQPQMITREVWCPDGDCFPHPNPQYTNQTHIIIHHSAGSNSLNDWAAEVRSIWDLHVNINGWSDIGYNWLISPKGDIYVGRGNDILGAHFCAQNSNTAGICVMGNYTNVIPTEEAFSTLYSFIKWKTCLDGLDPLKTTYHPSSGKYLPDVTGHKVDCATACPGDAFYPLFDDIRAEAYAQLQTDCLPGAPVDSFSAIAIDWDVASLAWQYPLDDIVSFEIERSLGRDNKFLPLKTLNVGIHSTLDTVPTNTTTAWYRVRTVSPENVASVFSDEIEVNFQKVSNNHVEQTKVFIYPNPSTGLFNIEHEKPVKKILAYNILGQELALNYDRQGDKKTIASIANLASNIVVLYIEFTDNQSLTKRLIIQNH